MSPLSRRGSFRGPCQQVTRRPPYPRVMRPNSTLGSLARTCPACMDVIIGPSICCAVCQLEVHSHCMQVVASTPYLHGMHWPGAAAASTQWRRIRRSLGHADRPAVSSLWPDRWAPPWLGGGGRRHGHTQVPGRSSGRSTASLGGCARAATCRSADRVLFAHGRSWWHGKT